MAILINQVPILNLLGIQIGHYKSLVRSLETRSIGIGGDSHVRIQDGQLRIGPERLGPAMAYGGNTPTPTDALVALGLVSDSNANSAASVEGLKPLSAKLGKTVSETAQLIFDHTCDQILSETEKMIQEINSKPVYTVHEVLEEYTVKPKKILVLGGPANHFAKNLEKRSGKKTEAVPRWSVANAIGAALARTTCELTLFVDTQQGLATAPEEEYSEKVPNHFSRDSALKIAYHLLQEKALKLGAHCDDLAMEVIEDLQFNMVRGFYTAGKNIRLKVQVKPGLIHGYDRLQLKT
jgi:N-methylhydantoinase A